VHCNAENKFHVKFSLVSYARSQNILAIRLVTYLMPRRKTDIFGRMCFTFELVFTVANSIIVAKSILYL